MPSTVISSFHYDAEKTVLKVIFTTGKVYEYINVPAFINEEMRAAFSKGTYFNERVKGHYKFRKIK